MAFKLNKKEVEQLPGYASELRGAMSAIEDAIDIYNLKLNDAKGFIEDIASNLRGEFDDKSEAWQEGERGTAVNEFIETFESFLHEFDDLELDSSDAADVIEDLEHEVQS